MMALSVRKFIICIFIIFAPIFLLTLCSKNDKDEIQEIILAKIGDKKILLKEFIQRSEYTIRPNYCKGNNNIHKKIVLNSLIAEKMLALEAGENLELSQNRHFQRYIQGRQEQAMRQLLYEQEGVNKVKLNSTEIKRIYKVAGRKYNIQYFTLNDESVAIEVQKWLNKDGKLFEDIYKTLSGNENIPEREVEWQTSNNEVIHEALFTNVLDKNQIIGPLKTDQNSYIVIKIDGWVDRLAISTTDIQQRWNDVSEKLKEKHALKIYENYVANVMKGQKIEFVNDTFYKLVNLFAPIYLSSNKEKEKLLLDRVIDRTKENETLEDLGDRIEVLRDKDLYMFNNKIWTVRDFEQELERHPLVFRKRNIESREFGVQFKLAVVDMMRDFALNDEAYNRGYDQFKVIKRYTRMWRDALVALYQKQKYLKTVISERNEMSSMDIITDYLNPYIDELQKKYNYDVEINVEQFEKIKFSRIDMVVLQQNVPFPVYVPYFPQVTTDHKLDYGRIF